MDDDKIETGDLDLESKSCKICQSPSRNDICVECLRQYYKPLKDFLDKHPGISYLEACFNKDLPVPRHVLYEFTNAKILKVK